MNYLLSISTMGIQLTYFHKKEIILPYQVSPGIINCAFIGWANERFSTSIIDMTVSRIFDNQSLFAEKGKESPDAKIIDKIVSHVVEDAFIVWFFLWMTNQLQSHMTFYAKLPIDFIQIYREM